MLGKACIMEIFFNLKGLAMKDAMWVDKMKV